MKTKWSIVLLLLLVIQVLFLVPAVAGTHCFNSKCFEINSASGLLIDGINLMPGDYRMIITDHSKNNEKMFIDLSIHDNHAEYNSDWFTASIDTKSGKLISCDIKGNHNNKKVLDDMLKELVNKLKPHGYMKSGDVINDSVNMPLGNLGTIKMKAVRKVLGVTTYKGNNLAAVEGYGSGGLSIKQNGKKLKVKLRMSSLTLHDPATGIILYSWITFEGEAGNKSFRELSETSTVVEYR